MIELDAVAATILNLSEEIVDLTEVPLDPVGKFLADAQLSHAVGKPGFAEAMEKETANLDIEKLFKNRNRATSPAPALPVVGDEHRLQKRFTRSIHDGKKATRVEKSQNGKWIFEFDENNQLLRGYVNDDEAV